MTAHSLLPPSAAARWCGQRCTASPALEAKHAGVTDQQHAQSAVEGNAAHWIAAEMLRGRTYPTGTATPGGPLSDEEMTDAAEVLCADIVTQTGGDLRDLHIEERVDAASVHPDNWGTPDVWAWTPSGSGGLLLVWDFKYGHRFVDAFENWQLIDYVAGIISRPEFIGLDHRKVEVVLTVVQPRNYHPVGPVRRWTETLTKLHPYFAQLTETAAEATGPNAATRTGPQCTDCRARHVCDALHYAADNVADVAGGAVSLELPPAALGLELKMLQRAQELLAARVTGLEAQATALLRSGQVVPFFSLGSSPGREQWTRPPAEVVALGELMGVALAKSVTAVTPKQARDAGMDAAIVAGYSTRPPGALKLIPIDNAQMKRIFVP